MSSLTQTWICKTCGFKDKTLVSFCGNCDELRDRYVESAYCPFCKQAKVLGVVRKPLFDAVVKALEAYVDNTVANYGESRDPAIEHAALTDARAALKKAKEVEI